MNNLNKRNSADKNAPTDSSPLKTVAVGLAIVGFVGTAAIADELMKAERVYVEPKPSLWHRIKSSFTSSTDPAQLCALTIEGNKNEAQIYTNKPNFFGSAHYELEQVSGPLGQTQKDGKFIPLQKGQIGTFTSVVDNKAYHIGDEKNPTYSYNLVGRFTQVSITGWAQDDKGQPVAQGTCKVIDPSLKNTAWDDRVNLVPKIGG